MKVNLLANLNSDIDEIMQGINAELVGMDSNIELTLDESLLFVYLSIHWNELFKQNVKSFPDLFKGKGNTQARIALKKHLVGTDKSLTVAAEVLEEETPDSLITLNANDIKSYESSAKLIHYKFTGEVK
jgi:hypothetical protein